MAEILKGRHFNEISSLVGSITLNRVVSLEKRDLYKQAAGQIHGVVVDEIVGPNSSYHSTKDKIKKITGKDQSLIRIIATPDELTQLMDIVKKLKRKNVPLSGL